jgi:hypothetical protein
MRERKLKREFFSLLYHRVERHSDTSCNTFRMTINTDKINLLLRSGREVQMLLWLMKTPTFDEEDCLQVAATLIQRVRKVAVHFLKVFEVTSTTFYIALN